MEHAAQAWIIAHDAQTVAVCLPVVDDDREIQLQRQLQLRAQHDLLRRLRGGIPVIVQTDLADGDGARGRRSTVAGIHDERNAALMHGAQHLFAVGVELSAVVVRVGIEILRHSA